MVPRGTAILPLHRGRAPRWLFSRMVEIARCIASVIKEEYGVQGLLERLSDPWFFQSLSCVLGYDWHSSGTTTVTCGALKEAIDPGEFGIGVAGGKGGASRRAPEEIAGLGAKFSLSGQKISNLVYASRMSAKVDNSLVQDGYRLYHHTFFLDEKGDWTVIQQGINHREGNARRYHWPLDQRGFIEEPQNAIICETRLNRVLDMTSVESHENRDTSLDLVNDGPRKLEKLILDPIPEGQLRLDKWTDKRENLLVMPRSVNWDALRDAYEFQPSNYEELISLRGIGPSTVRGLALVAELIYGDRASWRDPVRFNFAFGGKDGVPFPVDRKGIDDAISVLKAGIFSSEVKIVEKERAINRLRKCVPSIPDSRT